MNKKLIFAVICANIASGLIASAPTTSTIASKIAPKRFTVLSNTIKTYTNKQLISAKNIQSQAWNKARNIKSATWTVASKVTPRKVGIELLKASCITGVTLGELDRKPLQSRTSSYLFGASVPTLAILNAIAYPPYLLYKKVTTPTTQTPVPATTESTVVPFTKEVITPSAEAKTESK